MNQSVETMRDTVLSHMREQESRGKLSKAHGYDHVENVARYAGAFAGYLARRMDLDPERISAFAQMAGWSHDVIRYASEVESGESASARFLQSLYYGNFDSIPAGDYQRLVIDVVENSDQSFERMREIYKDDPEALAVALALVAGDKLIEASGPRVLERRSFFVGGERMRNPKDLGAVFQYPNESDLGILSETFVRLGDVNHISNYFSDPLLLGLAEQLHTYQYLWYRGMLWAREMTQGEALAHIVLRLQNNDVTKKLAERTTKGGLKLVEEDHLGGRYFFDNKLMVLWNALDKNRDLEELAKSSSMIVSTFAQADSPEAAIEGYRQGPKDPQTFRRWMDDIIAYREGSFADELLERLSS